MKKVIRKVNYLYYKELCRLYSIFVAIDMGAHHYDEYKTYIVNGMDIGKAQCKILYKYYPKWVSYFRKMLKYK